jgi:putative NADPH-quinone reductase
MSKYVLIINGYPDPRAERFMHALADAYRADAEGAGQHVHTLTVGELEFRLLRTTEDFDEGKLLPRSLSPSNSLLVRITW